MKPIALAGIVAGVFVCGVGVGLLLQEPAPAPLTSRAGSSAAAQAGEPSARVAFGPGEGPATGRAAGTDGGGAEASPAAAPPHLPPPGGPGGGIVEPPPPPPPPIPAEALREGEALAREADLEGTSRDPGGKVTPLVYDFESEEERKAWEAKYRKRWEKRLQREIEIKIKIMREKVGLQAHQESELREVLTTEYQERGRLTAELSAKTITRKAFDEAARANVTKAREALQRILTEEQLASYSQLKPREQVLREETH